MKPTRLKKAIFESGLCQADIAAAIGVSESALSRYSTGRRDIPQEIVQRIAGVLGVSPDTLVDPEAAPEDVQRKGAG